MTVKEETSRDNQYRLKITKPNGSNVYSMWVKGCNCITFLLFFQIKITRKVNTITQQYTVKCLKLCCVWDCDMLGVAPGRVVEALRADSPPQTRSAGTDHRLLEKTDSSPLGSAFTSRQPLQIYLYVDLKMHNPHSCSSLQLHAVSDICLVCDKTNAVRFHTQKYIFVKACQCVLPR